jgi:3-dehydroquinate synthase
MMEIQSRSHPYTVEEFPDLKTVLRGFQQTPGVYCLADKRVFSLYAQDFSDALPAEKVLQIEASEEQKSFEVLAPIFVWLLKNGLRRDGCLLVVGGGVLQDIGCFIASVLFRGIRWELVPTTLLAQCDSCIGSKSSINIQSYKNQIGTFYPPHRVCMTFDVLRTLPWDELRSGLGEAIKLHLLTGEEDFRGLMSDLDSLPGNEQVLPKWIMHSLEIKKAYIEKDELDKGVRNLLNYGHTFGHAYESASHYAIPHGIGVTLGMLTATFVSSQLGWVTPAYFHDLRARLQRWYQPYEQKLKALELDAILTAIKHDKKNTRDSVNCILTRGAGQMEKHGVNLDQQLRPWIARFISSEC